MEKLFDYWLKGIAFSLANEKINLFKPRNLEVDYSSIYSIVQNNHDFYYTILNQIIEKENKLVEFIERARINGLNDINDKFKSLSQTFLDYSRDLILWNVIYGNYQYFHLTIHDLIELTKILEYGKGNKRMKRSMIPFHILENLSPFLVFYLNNYTHDISRTFRFLFENPNRLKSNLRLSSEILLPNDTKLIFLRYSIILLGILFPYSRIGDFSFSILNKDQKDSRNIRHHSKSEIQQFPFIESIETSPFPVIVLFSSLSLIFKNNQKKKEFSFSTLNFIFEKSRFNKRENKLERSIIKIFYSSLFDQYEKYYSDLFYEIIFLMINSDNLNRSQIYKDKILIETDYLKNTFEFVSFLLGMSIWPPISDYYTIKFSKLLNGLNFNHNFVKLFYTYIISIKLHKENLYLKIEDLIKSKIDYPLNIIIPVNSNNYISTYSNNLHYNGFTIFYYSIFIVLDYSSIYYFVKEKIFSIINEIHNENFNEKFISELFGIFKGLQSKLGNLKKQNWDFLTELMKIMLNNYRFYLTDWKEDIVTQLDQTLSLMNELVRDKSYYKMFQQIRYA